MNKKIKVVLWDVGGVLTQSPIKRFERYEKTVSLPKGSIVKINSINNLNNAWAKYEKNMISKKKFIKLFKNEAKSQNILKVDPLEILSCLELKIVPDMLETLKKVKKKYLCACLTNNFDDRYLTPSCKKVKEILNRNFDFTFESSKLKCRKPEYEIYEMVIKTLNVKNDEILFIDDLGINLKPARHLGINTYKSSNTKDTISFLNNQLDL
tara:strand:- start:650 stop:1279 length:630 start_codon:yes stop_codon:yes gene_type:complete